MKLRIVSTCALLAACGGRYRTEAVGNGTLAVQPRGAAATPAAGIPLTRGAYVFALTFDVPRAQVIEWTVSCAGVEQHGTAGETFEAYRERRLAELRKQRERERQNVAAVSGAVIGAVAPSVHAHGQASGPNSTATVDAHVSGQAIGQAAGTAIADATVQDVIELPHGDVGAGRYTARARFATSTDGACMVTAVADDQSVIASYDVSRIRDLKAEAREKRIATSNAALEVRGQLSAQLVAFGADVTLRQRRLDEIARANAEAARAQAEAAAVRAEAARVKARADAEAAAERAAAARVKADAEARVRFEAQLRVQAQIDTALHTRTLLVAYLAGECKADPHRRARLEQERDRQRIVIEQQRERQRVAFEQQRERQRLAFEQQRERQRVERERQRLERERQRLEREQAHAHRVELALAVRADLRAYLVSLGARERPPRPAPLPESPGPAPFDGAAWIAGNWTWTGVEWTWEAGGWRDTQVISTSGTGGGGVAASGGGGVSIGADIASTIVDTVRDHRDSLPQTNVRDHRTTTEPPKAKEPVVRDHRTTMEPPKATEPVVRDHRKTDDKKEEQKQPSGPNVRDHRR